MSAWCDCSVRTSAGVVLPRPLPSGRLSALASSHPALPSTFPENGQNAAPGRQGRLTAALAVAATLRRLQPVRRRQRVHLHSVAKESAVAVEEGSTPATSLGAVQPSIGSEIQCRWCHKTFPSRSQLFKHLRRTAACADAAERDDPENAAGLAATRGIAHFIVFKVGYVEDAAHAEAAIRETLSLAGAHSIELARASGDASRSQERDHGLGESIVRQERSCGAIEDIVSATFVARLEGGALMSRIAASIEHYFDSNSVSTCSVLDVRMLPQSARLNAEACCTQRVYNYLLPYWTISPGLAHVEPAHMPDHADRLQAAAKGEPMDPDPELRRVLAGFKATIKDVMRSLDCEEEENAAMAGEPAEGEGALHTERRQYFGGQRLYGSEYRKRYRWHNFAPPELAGSLSPTKEAVRSALDRVVHAETLAMHGELWMALAVYGDHFLTQQCRRIVATLLAVHHGWLPRDFFRTATRAEVIISTPVAPEHLLHLQKCSFAAWTRYHGQVFDRSWKDRVKIGVSQVPDMPDFTDYGGRPLLAWRRWRQQLHSHIESVEYSPDGQGKFASWMQKLQHEICPRIRAELEVIAKLDDFAAGRWSAPIAKPSLSPCPQAYQEVLRLLQGLVEEGRWPPTSPARAQVVRAGDGGTFSIGTTQSGMKHAPKATSMFPELASALFALEKAIAPPGRTLSTMVAVNHNALFSPHIDAGAGEGQSKSLIVGLGDYVGGELVIEGNDCDIRYQPMEFDGWRQRHWTLPFSGQRFSLVWFTPS